MTVDPHLGHSLLQLILPRGRALASHVSTPEGLLGNHGSDLREPMRVRHLLRRF